MIVSGYLVFPTLIMVTLVITDRVKRNILRFQYLEGRKDDW